MTDQRKPDQPAAKPVPVIPQNEKLDDRDDAAPGTPGTGEVIDPKTGETRIQGIGGG